MSMHKQTKPREWEVLPPKGYGRELFMKFISSFPQNLMNWRVFYLLTFSRDWGVIVLFLPGKEMEEMLWLNYSKEKTKNNNNYSKLRRKFLD